MTGLVHRHALARIRPVMIDDGRGNQEATWPADTEEERTLRITGWALDSGTTTEDLVNRDGDEVAFIARGPIDADVQRGDRIRLDFDGHLYLIEGAVARQPGPSRITSHTVLQLKRWEE
ncbi:hypothetical protein OVA14_07205 [Agrococcus sp. SL85]|uniref:hypothetical protein n=1 Tax=Agrococcus sp. SL85 TaxID=2995141 RepID=UPI00226D1B5E|nr:hypothetical protein [Agrococcus sp. SL85]WAC65180.1 hypothetical protein OVA14_07205 [Agrococcus sp. SL85]